MLTHHVSPVMLSSPSSKCAGRFFAANRSGQRPAVLLLHGIPGNEQNWDLATVLGDCGVHSLLINYQGSWGLQGSYDMANHQDDAIAAYEWLIGRSDVDASRVMLVGMSLGGHLALKLLTSGKLNLAGAICLNPLANAQAYPLPSNLAAEWAPLLSGVDVDSLMLQWSKLPPFSQMLSESKNTGSPIPVLTVTSEQDELFSPLYYKDHLLEPLDKAEHLLEPLD